MVEFKSFQMFLILMIPFAAVTQHYSKIIVRAGDEATLSCEDVKDLPDKCHSTTWIFNYLTTAPAETLFEYGKIHREAASKSDRLSVTEKCSLVIKKVTDEDVGRYTCRQFDESGKQLTYSDVYLTVIKRDNVATATTTTTKLPTTTTKRKTKATTRPTTTIKATTKATKATTRPTTTKATSRPTTTTTADPAAGETSLNADLLKVLIPVAVVSAALLIIIVVVIRWKRSKGNNSQLDDNTAVFTVQADPPDGVSYASIRYKKKTKSKVRVQGEDDMVTYSTLNTSTGISLH